MPEGDLYEQLVEAMHGLYGVHAGRRAAHAKGVWCEGTFTATPEAAQMSRAVAFRGDPVTTLVRFSNGSGDPESHDAYREARCVAVKLRPDDGDEMDILATTARAFATRTPEDFLELLRLRKPDPETGQPDMEKLGVFLGEHPEAQPAIQSVLGAEPPASFATLTYYSPHSFRLVDGDGNGTWARFRWRPGAGEETIPDDEARERGRDYLSDELGERLRAGTVEFELLLQLAGDDDPIDDPSAVWPDDRELVTGGTLEITALVDDPEGGGHIDVFDPMRLADGVEPSDDPVLHARPKAYSVSAYERLG
jgi:catalase